MVRRIYVEKKKGFDIEAAGLLDELKKCLELPRLAGVRILYRYDMEGIDEETYERAKQGVFSEPATDMVCDEELPKNLSPVFFALEYLPGQFDQKADSAAQCIKMLNLQVDAITIHFAKIIALDGNLSAEDISAIKKYCINPVDSRKAGLSKPDKLTMNSPFPDKIKIIENFITFTKDELLTFKQQSGFAMSDEDILFVQQYFSEKEKRNPTITELRVLDTYWSDHCRHTTFFTNLTDIQFEEGAEAIKDVFGEYIQIRKEVHGNKEKDICLMDIACIGAKYLKQKGLLDDLDESDEVNACSIKIKVDIDEREEDWLLMFKNETHNHPTEIEPFGGASTCLGGAIRDPLSGRVYVYQAMRITGAGDPRKAAKDTLAGKLPQRKITQEAAAGYSSYGNQIGLSAGQVVEIYDEGYVAKRMELGAVIGAAPAENVRRKKPVHGDVIILVGGRTGRDGCGGATGSSKGHTEESSLKSGAEVQKGNPLIERNIQRLFRRKEVSRLIKKCNDFGAGGVSVAIGELADSIDVNLDLVPVKYDGLDGTELAISESQERMATVVAECDKDAFIAYAEEEDLEATVVAKVTDTGRFRIFWRGDTILDLDREFLDTSGVTQEAKVMVKKPDYPISTSNTAKKDLVESLSDLNCCSQKGLVERFDSTSGAATILMPLGGKYQLSPALGMAAKLPVLNGETNTATLMTYGFDPKISKESPFHGAMYAALESITKIAAMGGDISKVRLTFQEYFERMKDSSSWGKPFAALLGAFKVQKELGIPSIGGKDSMSGTFMELDVPPTLVSFAVCICSADKVVSPEFKTTNSKLILVNANYDENGLPDFIAYKAAMSKISDLAAQDKILSANTVGMGGIFVSLVKMAVGNKISFKIKNMEQEKLRRPDCTAVILEIAGDENIEELFKGLKYEELGSTTDSGELIIEDVLSVHIEKAIEKWIAPLEEIFPVRTSDFKTEKDCTFVETISYKERFNGFPKVKTAKPQVLIPVFYGTTCEAELKRAFEKAGAEVCLHIIHSLNQKSRIESIGGLAEKIRESQIVIIPGGAAAFRNERVKEAIADLMENRDGLMLGVGTGFQALIKLGLVPYGKITDLDENSPALTYNKIGRFMSRIVRTRIVSVKSPWFQGVSVGDIHTVSAAHEEGRFIASVGEIEELAKNGQIAAQYVDFEGKASMDIDFNPSCSQAAIEAITSPDGRIMGKMSYSERIEENLYKNVQGNYNQKIFESGVKYFK